MDKNLIIGEEGNKLGNCKVNVSDVNGVRVSWGWGNKYGLCMQSIAPPLGTLPPLHNIINNRE